MSVGDEDEVYRRQMMNFEARLFESFNNLQPLRPDGIDQHIHFVRLDQERGVANPGNTNFTLPNLRETRLDAGSPERLVKSEGMRTVVRKLRLCQSGRGRNLMRVERLFSLALFSAAWRTTFLRLFFEKGIGTVAQAYKLESVNQNLLRSCFWVVFGEGKKVRDNAMLTRLRRGYGAPDPSSQSYDAPGRAPLQVNILERILPASDRVVCGH